MTGIPYGQEQVDHLADLLPGAVSDPDDIKRLLSRAGLQEHMARALPNESRLSHWDRGVALAQSYGLTARLVEQLAVYLKGRTDVPALQAHLGSMRQPMLSDAMGALAVDLWQEIEALTDDEAPVPAESLVGTIRRRVRDILTKLDDRDFWPDLTPGQSYEQAQRVRDILVARCIDTLSTCDLLRSILDSNFQEGVSADERDRLRYLVAHSAACAEAKGKVIRSSRALFAEVRRRLP